METFDAACKEAEEGSCKHTQCDSYLPSDRDTTTAQWMLCLESCVLLQAKSPKAQKVKQVALRDVWALYCLISLHVDAYLAADCVRGVQLGEGVVRITKQRRQHAAK